MIIFNIRLRLAMVLCFVSIGVTSLQSVPAIFLTQRQLCDLELICNGGFAPVSGFMTERDYNAVVTTMRLADGQLFPMPIVLDVGQQTIDELKNSSDLELRSPEGFLLAVLHVTDIWQPNKVLEAECVFGTTNTDHPGVHYLFNKTKEYYLGGSLTSVAMPKHYDFVSLRKTPQELKAYFKENNISRVVAFQTRNPMHRAHFELTSRAAQQADAHLLLHPVVGMTKPGDVNHFTRVHCYKALMNRYQRGSATLSLLPLAMRMAGPREALWHAIIRKNYGCTHFIVGRDHAGVSDRNGKSFYGIYDAQEMVMKYAQEVGIIAVPFNAVAYLPDEDRYEEMSKVTPGTKVADISGTQLRKMLNEGTSLPTWFTFPEIDTILHKVYPPRSKQGCVLFFTGLSGSGKSTLANAVAIKLMELQDRKISLLDGDLVRKFLTSELGFSPEHRSLNIRRIGFVANEAAKNGGIALCAAIAPYDDDRRENRELINAASNYIEIYVSTSLDVCEKRDTKGLYKKARQGLLPQFTGISDRYDIPQNPEIIVDTETMALDEAVAVVIKYLQQYNFIPEITEFKS